MLITLDSRAASRLLRIYGIRPPIPQEREAAAGVPVTIDGIGGVQSQREIRLKIDGRRASRACPLDESDARALAAEFGHDGAALVNLLVKCSKLFAESGLAELHLLLYVTAQSYRTHAMYLLRDRRIARVQPIASSPR